MSSRLSNLKPILRINTEDHTEIRVPNPMLVANISRVWDILGMVVQDWERESAPFQEAINTATTDGARLFHIGEAHVQLETCFLKCIFSYALFFVSLKKAYDCISRELTMLRGELNLKVGLKRPEENPYIQKVIKRIRDLSIAHMGSTERASAVDAYSAMAWNPLASDTDNTGAWDINRITFRKGTIISRDSAGEIIDKSADFEIRGISEMKTQCMNYIDKYDSVCAEYLCRIKASLPITVDNIQYVDFQASAKGVSNP